MGEGITKEKKKRISSIQGLEPQTFFLGNLCINHLATFFRNSVVHEKGGTKYKHLMNEYIYAYIHVDHKYLSIYLK